MTKELLSVDDLSEYLNIKKSTVYSLLENGELPHYKIGRLIRCKRSDVDAWMESHRIESIDAGQRAKKILKTARSRADIDKIVKKSIESVKNSRYNSPHGKPDRIKGLRREVSHGTL